MWPAMHVYPDLTHSERIFSQFSKNLGIAHMELVKYVLQYVSGILDLCLTFDREAITLDDIVGYTNSDFARLKTIENQ